MVRERRRGRLTQSPLFLVIKRTLEGDDSEVACLKFSPLFISLCAGKITVYLGKRDFVDRLDGVVDPIDGVVVIDNEYLKNKQVYGLVRHQSVNRH